MAEAYVPMLTYAIAYRDHHGKMQAHEWSYDSHGKRAALWEQRAVANIVALNADLNCAIGIVNWTGNTDPVETEASNPRRKCFSVYVDEVRALVDLHVEALKNACAHAADNSYYNGLAKFADSINRRIAEYEAKGGKA